MFPFRKKPAAALKIVCQPGGIHVYAPGLFGDSQGAMLARFAQAVFQSPDVQTIVLDRRRATVSVRFPPGLELADLLEHLSRLITTSPGSIDETLGGLLEEAGHLQEFRVDREGTGFACQPPGVRRQIPGTSGMRAELLPPMVENVVTADEGSIGGVTRLLNLAGAGGMFAMSIVGVVVPGIPTVPFVLLTSYFLVRSSPALNRRLLRSRMFGPLLRDWQQHRALRPEVKRTAIALMLLMLVLGIVLSDLNGPALAVVLVVASIGFYSIVRLPTLSREMSELSTEPARLVACPGT